MSTSYSKKQKKIAYLFIGGLIFLCSFLSVLIFSYNVETLGFKEENAYISSYSVMGKVPKQYIIFKDSYGNEYSSTYSCPNGTRPLYSKVKLFIRQERFSIPFLYTKDINNVINGSALACNQK